VHLPKGQHYSFHPANKYFHVKQIRAIETAILINLRGLLNRLRWRYSALSVISRWTV
jgi:hypothetical protein